VAIIVGDLFVQYPKLEVRFWFLTLGMLLLSMLTARNTVPVAAPTPVAAIAEPAANGVGAKQV
jgi:hypothetical protein